jgi:CRP-like cAMP-binding protein
MTAPRIDELREQWDRAVERDRPGDAVVALAELEKLEADEPRWSQRLGESLRRLGKMKEAEEAFVRATERYFAKGFVPRAIAMAKLVTSLNPARTDLLARIEPPKAAPAAAAAGGPAPAGVRSGPPASLPAKPVPLRRAEDSHMDEIRFGDLEGPSSLDILLDDVAGYEFADNDRAPVVLNAPPAAKGHTPVTLPVPVHPPAKPTPAPVIVKAATPSRRLPEPEEPSIDRLGAMATFRLFAGLSRDALLALSAASELVEFIPKAMVMVRNEPAFALYALIEGTVRVTVRGSPEIRLGEGDIIGEGCLLDEGERQADVRAETEVMALRIEKKKLDEMTEQYPEIGDSLFQLLARRLVMNLMYASPLFASFEPKVRLELAQLFEIRRAEPDTVLSERGKRADGLYVLLAGNVTATDARGETRIARGSTFGHASLIGATPAAVTVRTASEAVLLRLPAGKFSSLAAIYPPVLALLAETADEPLRASLIPE